MLLQGHIYRSNEETERFLPEPTLLVSTTDLVEPNGLEEVRVPCLFGSISMTRRVRHPVACAQSLPAKWLGWDPWPWEHNMLPGLEVGEMDLS